ncbi:hypothetical protein PAHAL_9G223900 [Panicum hallii]|uniref:Uncharacterized protein n=1 Tax=Panicum hallii TaxID=206008 RepID=A0A2S3ILJ4_9POAL|nr:uncharacterized protein LOC112874145 [Panicum hallii]PAN46909.1 hypothetical protein PAHAL_9G223900 [Panicum hallii]
MVAGVVLKFKQSWRQNVSLAPRSSCFPKSVCGCGEQKTKRVEVGMKRQQHRKNYPSGIRSAGGQTTLQSFLVKPRVVDDDVKPSPLPPPEVGEEEAQICPPEPPKREIVRVIRTTIKEKASAFSSVGSAGKDGGGEAGGALSAAVFKRFHSSAPVARAEGDRAEAGEDGERDFGGGGDVRLDVEEIGAASRPEPRNKRKSPLGGDEHGGDAKARRVVVLGDDPRPRPAWRRGRARPTRGGGEGGRALYNHYASGGGWWHGDMEGVDGEEVGWTDDMWEGMGSVTLGGLEWH